MKKCIPNVLHVRIRRSEKEPFQLKGKMAQEVGAKAQVRSVTDKMNARGGGQYGYQRNEYSVIICRPLMQKRSIKIGCL